MNRVTQANEKGVAQGAIQRDPTDSDLRSLFLFWWRDLYVASIAFNSSLTNALDQREIGSGPKRAMFLAILNNGFGFGQANSVQFS